MRRYSLGPIARLDLDEIRDYIARDSLSSAIRLIERLLAGCQRLADMPGIGREREELGAGIRSFPVSPYIVFYRVRERDIEIVRVLHGARDLEQFPPFG